jgi:hypothetical protein
MEGVGVFCIGKNKVVKIVHSSSEMVLRTTNHTIIYPSSDPSLEVIALCPTVWYWRWICVTKGWVESLRNSHDEGEMDLVSPTWRVGGLL